MFERWGSVEGDENADAIILQRREGRKAITQGVLVNFGLLAGLALWFAWTGSSVALALEIIAAAWLIVSGIRQYLYRLETLVMIAERRTQLLEQKLLTSEADTLKR